MVIRRKLKLNRFFIDYLPLQHIAPPDQKYTTAISPLLMKESSCGYSMNLLSQVPVVFASIFSGKI